MTVHLVGAGPGDPGLLTRRAAEVLAAADVVVHDRLVDVRVLSLVRPGARLIDVGKEPGAHDPGAQASINALLVRCSLEDRVVVRLKGGDPFLFGRGGEELEALRDAGVEPEIVPGVTSALGLPALVGLPLTRRGVAGAVTVVSGHDLASGSCDWSRFSDEHVTIVVLMGVAQRRAVANALVRAGRRASTPCAVIERGATPEQRVVVSTLGGLGDLDVEAPAVIVLGDVVGLVATALEALEHPTIASIRA